MITKILIPSDNENIIVFRIYDKFRIYDIYIPGVLMFFSVNKVFVTARKIYYAELDIRRKLLEGNSFLTF